MLRQAPALGGSSQSGGVVLQYAIITSFLEHFV
jgi:hypothetical protein